MEKVLNNAPLAAQAEFSGKTAYKPGTLRTEEKPLDWGGMMGATPPYQEEEIEETVLLTLLYGVEPEEDLYPEYQRQREWIYGHLTEEHFHFKNPATVYVHCKSLHDAGEPVTLHSLQASFVEAGLSQAERDDLMSSVERAARSIEGGRALEGQHCARSIIRYAVLRSAVHEATAMAAGICRGGRFAGAEYLDASIRRMQEIRGQLPGDAIPASVSEAGPETLFQRLEKQAVNPDEDVVSTGFSGLDRILDGGVRRGDDVVIGGRPGTGKSSLALGVAFRMALAGRRVLYCSLEMSRSQLEQRLLSMASGVGLSRIRHPDTLSDDEWTRLYAASPLMQLHLHIDDEPGLTPARLESKVRELRDMKGLDAVFVDYLQLMKPDGRAYSRENEVASMSSAMKNMAMTYQIPVVVLVQLNRALEGRDGQTPQLSDIRESGAIEQDADTVLLLARDMRAAYAAARRGITDSITTAVVAKQRSGSVGAVRMLYRGATTSYIDLGLRVGA